jgi:hypothetical protein
MYLRRSRMSDARRFVPDGGIADRCREHVARHGGADFFARRGWRAELESFVRGAGGRFESDDARAAAIRNELGEGRRRLMDMLRTTTVRHVALPWGIAGETARRAIRETGHLTAFAEQPFKSFAVRAGVDPYQLARLNGKYLTCLPGRGRRWFFTTVRSTVL